MSDSPSQLQESVWDRAFRDTKTDLASIRFWVVQVIVGGFAGGFGSPATGIFAVLGVGLAVLVFRLLRAPVLQRNEARGELSRLGESVVLRLERIDGAVSVGKFGLADVRLELVLKNYSSHCAIEYRMEALEQSFRGGGTPGGEYLSNGGVIPPLGDTKYYCVAMNHVPFTDPIVAEVEVLIKYRPLPTDTAAPEQTLDERRQVSLYKAGMTTSIHMGTKAILRTPEASQIQENAR